MNGRQGLARARGASYLRSGASRMDDRHPAPTGVGGSPAPAPSSDAPAGRPSPFRAPSNADGCPQMPARFRAKLLPLFVVRCATYASYWRPFLSPNQQVLGSIPRRRTNFPPAARSTFPAPRLAPVRGTSRRSAAPASPCAARRPPALPSGASASFCVPLVGRRGSLPCFGLVAKPRDGVKSSVGPALGQVRVGLQEIPSSGAFLPLSPTSDRSR